MLGRADRQGDTRDSIESKHGLDSHTSSQAAGAAREAQLMRGEEGGGVGQGHLEGGVAGQGPVRGADGMSDGSSDDVETHSSGHDTGKASNDPPWDHIPPSILLLQLHLPMDEAARQLGCPLTAVRQSYLACGSGRWPYRKVRQRDRVLQRLYAQWLGASTLLERRQPAHLFNLKRKERIQFLLGLVGLKELPQGIRPRDLALAPPSGSELYHEEELAASLTGVRNFRSRMLQGTGLRGGSDRPGGVGGGVGVGNIAAANRGAACQGGDGLMVQPAPVHRSPSVDSSTTSPASIPSIPWPSP